MTENIGAKALKPNPALKLLEPLAASGKRLEHTPTSLTLSYMGEYRLRGLKAEHF